MESLEDEVGAENVINTIVFLNTNNYLVERKLCIGDFSSPKLFDLVIRVTKIETKYSSCI